MNEFIYKKHPIGAFFKTVLSLLRARGPKNNNKTGISI